MAKRYHSSLLNESSGDCHLPKEVVEKVISKVSSVNSDVPSLYTCVEESVKQNEAALRKIIKPKKI